jgi:hypothetical protein
MHKRTTILGIFLLLVSTGCAEGPDEEVGTNFRTSTMEWPSLVTSPVEQEGPRGPLEQR